MLNYLFLNYGQFTNSELNDNEVAMKKAWDPADTFKTIILQIDDGIELAEGGKRPLSDEQLMDIAYTIVQDTGLYVQDLREWDRKPAIEKDWNPEFKEFMLERERELLKHKVSATKAGYNQANAAFQATNVQMHDILANLVTATSQDKTMIAELVNKNQQLMEKMKEYQDKMHALQNKEVGPNVDASTKKTFTRRPRTDQGSYCWTHGFLVHKDHNSGNFKFIKDKANHKADATRTNTMGGNMEGDPNKK
jgi:hypothetical protein